MSSDSECREVNNNGTTSHFTTIQLMEASTDTSVTSNGSANSGNRPESANSPTTTTTTNNQTSASTTNPSTLEEGRRSSSLAATAVPDYLYFDANTFKQVKRLYEGMLMVAIAYSITMVLMMIVLYKTLPQAMLEQQQQLHSSSITRNSGPPHAGSSFKHTLLNYQGLESKGQFDADHRDLKRFKSGHENYHSSFGTFNHPETAMNYLDQMIAINFLSLILYSLAFYAAHREMRTLTLAFTSTLGFTMMFSVVKLFVEGVHFPNNFMSLLLRVSIVFVALVYLGQLRRKQQYVYNANTFWLRPNSFLNHPTLRSRMSPNQTAQLIREFLASTGNGRGLDSDKTDEDVIREYQDQPPNYEEALRCPVPNRLSSRAHDGKSLRSTGSQITLSAPPPPFDQIASLDCVPACSSGQQQQQKQTQLHPLSVHSFEANGDAHSAMTTVEIIDDQDALTNGLVHSYHNYHPLTQSLTSINSTTIITVEDGEEQEATTTTTTTASTILNNNNKIEPKEPGNNKSDL